MIQCFTASYIKFEDEESKRKIPATIIEISNKKLAYIQLIVCSPKSLVMSLYIDSVQVIKGYRHYTPKNSAVTPFGIGGVVSISLNKNKAMLDALSLKTKIPYEQLST